MIDHVRRPAADRGIDHVGVDAGKFVRIVAAFAQNAALLGVAEVSQVDLVELQIAAAGIRERLHGSAIRQRQIAVELLHVRVDLRADGAPAASEVQHARRRNRHLRRGASVVAQETEVLHHGMRGKAKFCR